MKLENLDKVKELIEEIKELEQKVECLKANAQIATENALERPYYICPPYNLNYDIIAEAYKNQMYRHQERLQSIKEDLVKL